MTTGYDSRTLWEVSVSARPGTDDPRGRAVAAELSRLGSVTGGVAHEVRYEPLYLIEGIADRSAVENVAATLLADAVCEDWTLRAVERPVGQAPRDAQADFDGGCKTPGENDSPHAAGTVATVYLKPGVTDPAGGSVEGLLAERGWPGVMVRTARRYRFTPALSRATRDEVARRLLANGCIETVAFGEGTTPPGATSTAYQLRQRTVPLRGADDQRLLAISRAGHLALSVEEMRAVAGHFESLGRDPADIELETIAQTWSEHCVHKTLKARITYREVATPGGQPRVEVIDNLLSQTIVAATHALARPWCLSVFTDNAGVIAFDETWAVTFKVETHNRPSAIEPYGGAATGIGGCIRDTMGTGLGARPIASTNVFCVARPDLPAEALAPGMLAAQRVLRGVVAGVRDYGNRMGIPTVNGAVVFDDRYRGNPLVYCGNVGLMPRSCVTKTVAAGDRIVVAGGRTGRDGIHGATFSSEGLDASSETVFSHAVQIGHAIAQKQLLEALLAARDAGLYRAVTDCGAGGLSSAVGEMAEAVGARVNLERVRLKYQGLSHTEIWISEAQERMVLAVPPECVASLVEVFAAEGVQATDIGVFGATDAGGRPELELLYGPTRVGHLGCDFLHGGRPRLQREAVWSARPVGADPQGPAILSRLDEVCPPAPVNLAAPGKAVPPWNTALRSLLGAWNICSKEWVIRQYDHEVRGATVVKPLVGEAQDGPGDAAVLRPVPQSRRGVALGCGMHPRYGDHDPYWMALASVDEAVRNVVAVGADPSRVAVLDNFSWGPCTQPERLGELVRAARGCYDAALGLGTPFISGKDSLNNDFALPDGSRLVIPGSLLISAMGLVEDVTRCVTADAKSAGNLLYVVGATAHELGGSELYALLGETGGQVPRVNLSGAAATIKAVHAAITGGLVRACHDCSDGGLAVAVAEMAFAGDLGAAVDLRRLPLAGGCPAAGEVVLFSETPSRFVVEIAPPRAKAFEALMAGAGVPCGCVGRLEHEPWLVIYGYSGESLIEDEIRVLKAAWQRPLAW